MSTADGHAKPLVDIFDPTPWQMTFGERCVLVGVLTKLKPRLSVEIGTAEGGSLEQISAYSDEVHSFDLVEPSLPRERFANVTFHTGDSHSLLPTTLSEVASSGRTVDFALVDGDHTAGGVAADLRDLLSSPSIARTVILIHDTLNDDVRSGIKSVGLESYRKVAYVDLDFLAGHLSDVGPYRGQLWGGVGLVIVDSTAARSTYSTPVFADPFAIFSSARDAIVASAADAAARSHAHSAATADERTTAAALDKALRQLDAVNHELDDLRASTSWRLMAPARWAKRKVSSRRSH